MGHEGEAQLPQGEELEAFARARMSTDDLEAVKRSVAAYPSDWLRLYRLAKDGMVLTTDGRAIPEE